MTTVIKRTADINGIFQCAYNVVDTSGYPIEDWMHDPSMAGLEGVPVNYIKVVDETSLAEMTQVEKDAVDANLAAAAVITSSSHMGDASLVCTRHSGDVTQVFQQTYVAVRFGTDVRCDMSHFQYDDTDGSVTVVYEGWYLVMASVSVESTSTSRDVSVAELRIGGGVVEGSKAYGYHSAGNSRATLTAYGTIYLTAGQTVQIFVARDSGKSALQTIADGSRFTITNLDDPPA